MNYVENAIRRALSEVGDRYEGKMYWLATIVSVLRSWVYLGPFGESWMLLAPWKVEVPRSNI